MNSDLAASYAAKLKSSSLTINDAKKLGFQLVGATDALDLGPNFEKRGGFTIPYYDTKNKRVKDFFRFRYLDDPIGWGAAAAKPRRYVQPKDTGVRAYFPPLVDWASILATDTPVVFTEGELKAACATKHGIPTIGLGGVWSFRSKTRGGFLQELADVNWEKRFVPIVFDNDIRIKPQVRIAMLTLANELIERGALVYETRIPPGNVKGLDDFVVAYGGKALKELLNNSTIIEASARALTEMNEEIAYVLKPGVLVVLEDVSRIRCADSWHSTYSTRTHIESVSKVVDGEERVVEKVVDTLPRWMKWDRRRELKSFTYAPGDDSVTEKGECNLWKGWGVVPKTLRSVNSKHIKPWHDFMSVIFGTDAKGKEARKWFEKWAAYPIQHPGAKLYTACLFYSISHGTGKTLLGEILRKLYGENSSTPDHDDLLGNWNTWRAAKQFVLADEIAGGEKRISSTKLKGLITSEEFRLREKFMPEIQLPDCANFFFTSNHPDAIRIEYSDRRFFVWEVKTKATPEFFKMLDTWFRGDGCDYLFDYFRRLDLEDFEPKEAALHTDDKTTMAMLSASDLASWVIVARESPETFCAHCRIEPVEVISVDQLVSLYQVEVGGGRRGAGKRAMRVVLQEQGMVSRSVKPNGEDIFVELVALGNEQEKWHKAPDKLWIKALGEDAIPPRMEKY